MQAAMLRAELDALKAQINPHFLFNSLNTVHGLISQDPALARGLLLELSDVLRYALGDSNHDLVPLARELEFLHAYRALLQARHGEGLRTHRCLRVWLSQVHTTHFPPRTSSKRLTAVLPPI